MEALGFLEFGPFRIDLEQRLLFRGGVVISTAPKAFETLLVLVENHGRVVSKDDLLKRVWPDTFVEEGSLARNVSILRKVLGENADDQTFIETIPKRGYRFVAAVSIGPVFSVEPTTFVPSPAPALPRRPRVIPTSITLAALAALAFGLAVWRLPFGRPAMVPTPLMTDFDPIGAGGVISDDGKFVAYVAARPSPDGTDTVTVRVRQLATGTEQDIVESATVRGPRGAPLAAMIYGLTATPDGEYIDYVRASDYPAPPALWRVPFHGGAPPKMIVDDILSPVGWSPDRKEMAFIRVAHSQSDTLVVADAEGTHQQSLAMRTRPAMFMNMATGMPGMPVPPAWSPDGTVIAVPGVDIQNGVQKNQVVFVSRHNGQEQTVNRPLGEAGGLDWLDDKTLLLNQRASAAESLQFWLLHYPNGEVSKLTNDLTEYASVSLTADGNTLLTWRSDTRIGIWIDDGTGPYLVVQPTSNENIPNFGMTWAGDRLLYSSTANGYSSIMALVPGRTSPEEIIPHATYPSATSDGKTIVYQSTADGPRTGLWRSDGDGRNRKRILTGSVTNAVVLRDDRSVIFGSMENGMNSPWIASLDGNNKKEIVHLPVAGIRVSPDGDQLLINVAADGPPKPIICDMPDCSSQRPARFGRRWIPDGIAYIEDGDIWVQPVDQHLPPRVLARFSVADLGIVDFALSRDGKRLAVARASGTAAFVLFKGLQTPTSRLRAWLRRSLGN